jgi:hypothetical protein
MLALFGLFALGVYLGAILLFPAFAMVALACATIYAIGSVIGNWTSIGFIGNLLCAILALQFGYFMTVVVRVLYLRVKIRRHNNE